ncbi:TVA1 protein, partial [Amia calva]|nr:TVA1 protein [Amia calva]
CFTGMIEGAPIEQTPTVFVSENEKTTLYCKFEASTSDYLFWYIQKSNEAPKHILGELTGKDPKFKERFSANRNNQENTYNLTISAAVLSDSSTYFCALRPTMCQSISHPIQKLSTVSHSTAVAPLFQQPRSCLNFFFFL